MNRLVRSLSAIWTVRGALPLQPHSEPEKVLERLERLFDQPGTSKDRRGLTLRFSKVDASPQDPMSVFDSGELHVNPAGAQIAYTFVSRALGACFVAPAIFLAVSYGFDSVALPDRVFAALFAILYGVGRVREPRRVARLLSGHINASK